MTEQTMNVLGNGKKDCSGRKNWQTILSGTIGVFLAMVVMAVSVGAAITATDSAVGVAPIFEASQAAVKVEYYLPYPGILPDSPLYKLKVVRDRVKLWVTFDETEKAKMELELADKRINAALALAEGNKTELAITTATKAEKYLEQSVNRVIKLIKLGKDEKSQLLNLEKAIRKHGELLADISTSEALGESRMLNKLLGERVGQTIIEAVLAK